MEKGYRDFVKILRGFALGERPQIEGETDWKTVLYLANIHSVTGIVGYMVMQYALSDDPGFVGFMRQQCFSTIMLFTQRAEQMKVQIRRMNEAGIDHLLFKGYLVRELYPQPELRTFGDIDFVIRREDREKSNALMLSQGFQEETDWEPVFTFLRGTEIYEIHTDVMEVDVSDKADYKGYFSHIWEHAVCVGEHTWHFTPEFHFIYLLTHIAKHISGSGAGIRMYLDIAFYLQRYGSTMDWTWIAGELEKLKFTDYVNVVLHAVEKWFGTDLSGIPVNRKPVEDAVLDDFLEFTLNGGTFGHQNRDAGVVALKQKDRNDASVSRVSTLLHRLFPSAASIQTRYTYLQKRPWLLPAAWVHRLFRTRSHMDEHRREMKSIMEADSEEVLKLKRIYKEIGL